MSGDFRVGGARASALRAASPQYAELLDRLIPLAPRGLAAAYVPGTVEFAQTVRGVSGSDGVTVRAEGRNLRYAAMAALGLDRVSDAQQAEVLAGGSASEVTTRAGVRALTTSDPGAAALVAWALAEVNAVHAGDLFDRLGAWLTTRTALPAVDLSWMVTAAVAAAELGDTKEVLDTATERLLEGQGARGIYPHVLPATDQPRWRAHVGSFADQVYPLQALARAYGHTGEQRFLDAAETTAARLCELQGSGGQWWWHYDSRDGEVVEGFPVYSVHQHAMAPMVLQDLHEVGGSDHRASVASGLRWLQTHPECVEELVSERFGLVWRKVGRREPRKAARALSAATTSLRPGLRLPGLDRLLPPGVVDHECRPYELGWMLYAWLPRRGTDA